VANKPEVKIEYFSIERFIFNFVKSLQSNQIMHFKEKFKNIDILLIDDFQFINGKKGTQEEFLHIFNMLVNNGTQVILAGDRAPSSLNDINEAVKSRISGGLVVDIMPADYELRLQFAKQKLVSLIDDAVSREEIAKLMAEKITTSMRELEGAINKIKLNVETFGLSLSKESIILLLQESIISSHKPITIENIKKKVCEFYNISVADLNSLKRSRNIAKPRHVAMYLARKHTSLSLPEIGRNFGGKDHTSVIHAVKKIEENFKTDLSFQSKFRDLERGLRF
jgi:chromosomal replication initiator protein